MSEPSHNWMEFTRFVPGFDFLRNLVPQGLAGTPAAPSAPNVFQQWLAPTMDEAEVQKRIDELKTVQFWLEQNGRALQATIQALEVQKMTLSALKTMGQGAQEMAQGVADAFSGAQKGAHKDTQKGAGDDAAPPQAQNAAAASEAPTSGTDNAAATASHMLEAGMAEMQHIQGQALQWWGALTEQFQTIAAKALDDIGQQVSQQQADAMEAMGAMGEAMGSAAAAGASAVAPAATSARTAQRPASQTDGKAVAKKAAKTTAKSTGKGAAKTPVKTAAKSTAKNTAKKAVKNATAAKAAQKPGQKPASGTKQKTAQAAAANGAKT
ncbi:hypothetical protein EBQ26_08820 [Allofranklinella schreckenbergeri]|uniref:Uncharacterized protein n=1 Tax=Allofranklinella schreckenbergeri TaxID=1076744 RepID=A0A3M6Q2D1_9BURK|nr:PhaM family polyhydroxyalkanoate granule multifunctional regulatory protein [Allofranklinella schreckenbergeri]RMW96914.1 hypothetical protein EBQ26_08820 [Allofranklinella schreckenbergeri]RRD41696.1 hypothetical protein EII18_08160 [Comamonadaceae bacterium OH3737_COT-264]